MLYPDDWTALLLSFKLALISTLILVIISIPLAWWLTKAPRAVKVICESIVALPLILPPTVLGYYLLILFSPEGWLGEWWSSLTDSSLAFSFNGLIIGSVIYSLPFVIQPIFNAFERIPHYYLEAASNLGANSFQIVRKIAIPICKRQILMGCGLGFAHTIGEFGVVLMIGGNIPGETQVIAIQLYDHVESLNYQAANNLAFLLLVTSLILLILCYGYNQYSKCYMQK